MDIITKKKDRTKEFYSLVLRSLKLLIELHYFPFNPRGHGLNPLPEEEEIEDSANRDIRAGARIVLTDCDKFLKKLRSEPLAIDLFSIAWCLLTLRALRILIGIHFCCETGEGARLPSLAKPKTKGNVKHPLMGDLTEIIDELNQKDKEEISV